MNSFYPRPLQFPLSSAPSLNLTTSSFPFPPQPSGSSVITKNFAGSVRDVVRCDRSGEEVKRSSRTFNTLSLPVPRGKAFSLQVKVLRSWCSPY